MTNCHHKIIQLPRGRESGYVWPCKQEEKKRGGSAWLFLAWQEELQGPLSLRDY